MHNDQDIDEKQQQQQQRRYKQLLCKISFTDDPQSLHVRKYKYSQESIQPFVFFYKLLALRPCEKHHRQTLILNIPDTIVFNDGDNPIMWFYTNGKGEVCRIDNVPYNQITEKLSEGALQKELVAVLKKASYGYGGVSGNDVKLISASEMKIVISSVLASRGELNVIQKYVKSTSVKPSVVRTAWRVNGPNQSWILNSNYSYTSQAKVPQINKFIVNTKNPKTFNATKCGNEKYTHQTLKYLKNIADFVSKHLGIRFLQLVADFIKDQGDNWWFINTKAFILDSDKKISHRPITMHDDDPIQPKQKKKLETYTKCRKCRYCHKVVAEHSMNHKLTLMMLLQCDQNLVKMGKSFPWLERCYSQHVGTVNLYIEHKVCDSCYKLYMEIERLVGLEARMAKLLGVNKQSDNRNVVSITSVPSFKGQSPQFGSRLQKINYQAEMPEGWALPKDQSITISLINQKAKKLSKCRFMVFLHGIRDIPKQALEDRYFLQYAFLEHKVRYKIPFGSFQSNDQDPQNLIKIALNKIKVMYFFSQSRTQIKQFLRQTQNLEMRLIQNQDIIGRLRVELNQFQSNKVVKRDFFKMFSGAKIFPYLSWGLHVTLGLHQGQQIQVAKLKLTKKGSLFFPQLNYSHPDPLPEQWIQMIKEKPTIARETLSSSGFPQRDREKHRTNQSNSIISNQTLLEREIEDYGRRKIASQHKTHRKPHY